LGHDYEQRRHHERPAKIISDALYPGFNYVARLRERMERAGFPPGDRLYQLAAKAHDAIRQLASELHYLGCNGVGRPDRSE
jgi:hypothetical protein